MLGKWIYYGIVDDKFSEFMIIEKARPDFDAKSDMFDWQERFLLNPENVIISSQDTPIPDSSGR